MISFVVRSRIVCRLGWSLALGCRPAEAFKIWWYRLALFLYSSFSLCCNVFTSILFSLADDCRDSFVTSRWYVFDAMGH